MSGIARIAWRSAFALGMLFASAAAVSQNYPKKPVQIILPYAAGTPLDTLTRVVAAKLNERLGWSFIHDNRPGGDGIVAMQAFMRAPADGYTVLASIASLTVIPTIKKGELPYDPLKDVLPLTRIASLQSVLAANTSVPANTLAELIAYSKANPGKLNFATASRGSTNHLLGELLKRETGLDMANVPYKPGSQMQGDVVSGRVQLVVVSAPTFVSYVPNVKPIVIMSDRRYSGLPNVPAVGETVKALAGVDMDLWGGFMVRAGTPREIVDRLHKEIAAVLRLPEVQEKIITAGAIPVIDPSPEEALEKYKSDIKRWEKIILDARLLEGDTK